MKKIINLVIIGITLSACGSVQDSKKRASVDGSGPGNGGAAILRNGNLLTFGEANVRIFPEGLDDVPGLSLAIDFFKRLPLPDSSRGQLLSALIPVGARQYFKIDENDLGNEKRKILLKNYRQALGDKIPADALRIVAVTVAKETYLLPGFFQLKDDFSRAAILFHEALWAMNPNLGYKTVLASEVHFEKYLKENASKPELSFDSKFMQTLKIVTGDTFLGIAAAAKYEFSKSRNIAYRMVDLGEEKTFRKPKFRLDELVGVEACRLAPEAQRLNTVLAYDYLNRMVDANPRSPFWKEWLIEAGGLTLNKLVGHASGGTWSFDLGLAPRIGNETFDMRHPTFGYFGSYFPGFSGKVGIIGKFYRDFFGEWQRMDSLYLLSAGMQARVPRAIIHDQQKCEQVILYWEKEQPVFYQRCYEQWIED